MHLRHYQVVEYENIKVQKPHLDKMSTSKPMRPASGTKGRANKDILNFLSTS